MALKNFNPKKNIKQPSTHCKFDVLGGSANIVDIHAPQSKSNKNDHRAKKAKLNLVKVKSIGELSLADGEIDGSQIPTGSNFIRVAHEQVQFTEYKHMEKDGENTFSESKNNAPEAENITYSKRSFLCGKSSIASPHSECIRDLPPSIHTVQMSDIRVFDGSLVMSENPFDILDNRAFRSAPSIKHDARPHKSIATDEQLLALIKRPKTEVLEIKNNVKEGIFQKIKILSKKEVSLPCKKYYKFPFELSIVNDESIIFEKLRNTFTSALACAYSNYRKFGESFIVVLFNDIFVFSHKLKCTVGCLRLLKSNDISYTDNEDFAIIEDGDKPLVYDVIMNAEIPLGKPLPFILSEFEFDNGIVYRTKLEKGVTVKSADGIEYSYLLKGPLYSADFCFDSDIILKYD